MTDRGMQNVLGQKFLSWNELILCKRFSSLNEKGLLNYVYDSGKNPG